MNQELGNKSAIMVSLSSKVVNPTYLEYLYNKVNDRVDSLGVIFLDEPEIANQIHLEGFGEKEARNRVQARCHEIIGTLSVPEVDKIKFYYWKDFAKESQLQEYIVIVENEFDTNSSFRRHCLNQTFVNLQPLLFRSRVTRNDDPLVAKLSGYVKKELALKLFLGNQGTFDVEFAPRPEMDLVLAVYNKKYPRLNDLISRKLKFEVIPPDPSINTVTITDLNFKYSEEDFSIKNFSVGIQSGTTFGLLGMNASGKTTILKLIGGHLKPRSGKILLGGIDITNHPARERPTSTVFQDLALFPNMNVKDNVAFGLNASNRFNRVTSREIAEKYLEDYYLMDQASMKPSKLSLGTKQRVAIARALAIDPRVLLLDEPTASLDSHTRSKLIDMIRLISERSGDTTIIIVSHDKDFILSVCDIIGVIEAGKLVEVGKPRELCLNPPTKWLAEYLESGSIIEGTLDTKGIFHSQAGDLEFEALNKNVGLLGKGCAVLIKPDSIHLKPNSVLGFLSVTAKLIRATPKTHSYELTFCTAHGELLTTRVPHKEYMKFEVGRNQSFELGIDQEECILLS